jgi:hypothetical protein
MKEFSCEAGCGVLAPSCPILPHERGEEIPVWTDAVSCIILLISHDCHFAGLHVKPDLAVRIRQLCASAVVASDTELESITIELRSALQEHMQGLRHKAAEAFGLTSRDGEES